MQDIAIIGMACRFPGGVTTPEDYWRLLTNGVDAIVDIPADRWNIERYYDPDPDMPGKMYIRQGGFLTNSIFEFDPAFFGITPREAERMDPQQRLLLQVTWEALEDAQSTPIGVTTPRTGVFIGAFTMDNMGQQLSVHNRSAIMSGVSTTMTMLSNRISHTFDLKGPSVTVSTACSSSLVALRLAAQSLLNHDCDVAICGGVNLMFRPEFAIAMCKGRYLSPDAHCKTFDAAANGYARGEGAGIVILKRAEDAKNQHVYAMVAGTGVNQDGHTPGISVPDGDAQKILMQEVCDRAGVNPRDIQYVEAHGTGTAVGDPIELKSLGSVLAAERAADDKCWVGSVKTNIGHLEAAAGIASVIKVVLCLNHRQIPPHLNLKTINPNIDLETLHLRIPQETVPMPNADGMVYAAVNAFGYGGTNAHAILKDAPEQFETSRFISKDVQLNIPTTFQSLPNLFVLSARDDQSLHAMAQSHADYLDENTDVSLTDYGYTTARLRSHHDYRLAVAASSRAELSQRLRQAANDEKSAFVVTGRAHDKRAHKLAFVYSGMGGQSWGMASDLLTKNELFKHSIDKFDGVFRPLAGWSIVDLFQADGARPMTEPQYAQPANLALQMALTEIWRDCGIQADGIVGHSVGEIAAAWAAGSLSFEDAVKLIYHRSSLQQKVAKKGSMLAVGMSEPEACDFIADYTGRVALAVVNSGQSVVLAGDADVMPILSAQLDKANIFNRFLQVDVAYHSHHVEVIKDDFYHALADLSAQEAHTPLYSTVTGERLSGAAQNVDYWWRNNAQTVLFQRGIQWMLDDGYDSFLEIAPHPALNGHIRMIAGERDTVVVSSLKRGQPSAETLLTALGELYTFGQEIHFEKLHPIGNRVSLPTYAWRQDYLWAETAASSADRTGKMMHPLLQSSVVAPEPMWMAELTPHLLPYLRDHQIGQAAIFPASGYIEMMLAQTQDRSQPLMLEELHFQKLLSLMPTSVVWLARSPNAKSLTVYGADKIDSGHSMTYATGKIMREAYAVPRPGLPQFADLLLSDKQALDIGAMYERFARHELNYGAAFQTVRDVALLNDGVLARIQVDEASAAHVDAYWLHPTLLDGCFQSLLALMQRADDYGTYLPVGVHQVRWYQPAGGEVWCWGRIVRHDATEIVGDLVLYTPEGQIAAEIIGFELRVIDDRRREKLINRWFYELQWELLEEAPSEQLAPAHWLVFGDGRDDFQGHLIAGEHVGSSGEHVGSPLQHADIQPSLADSVLEKLGAARHTYTLVNRAGSGWCVPMMDYTADTMQTLIAHLATQPIDGVLYMMSNDVDAKVSPKESVGLAHCTNILALIQALTEQGVDHLQRLGIITRGAYKVDDTETLDGFSQVGLIGLGRVIANEYPLLNPMMIDLPAQAVSAQAGKLVETILSKTDETELALRESGRYVHRLLASSLPPPTVIETTTAEPCVLKIDQPGTLDNLYFSQTERVAPKDDEIEMRVHVSALNFKDLMKALALLPPRYLTQTFFGSELGLECAGEIVRVGKNVTRFKVGDQVVAAEGDGCFRSYNTISTRFVFHKPPSLSFAESVNFINFLTAYYGLHHIAHLQRGERVLIHAATGGVGLAAIQVAHWLGAEVYATAGSDAKRDLLTSLGVRYVTNSRSLRFADDIQKWTNGEGVDVVLNSLSDEFLAHSVELLAPLGRFIEIGKRDIIQNERLAMAAFDRNLTFSSVDIDIIGLKRPALLMHLMDEVHKLFMDGHFRAIPTTVYPAGEIVEAFRDMSQARHIGKVVIDMLDQPVNIVSNPTQQTLIQPDATYLVTGGFGGFGLSTAEWLVSQGARHLALVSRQGASSLEAQQAVARMREQGANVREFRADVSDGEQVAAFIGAINSEMPPLRGVIHSAMVLEDTFLTTMTEEQFKKVVAPKAIGAWHLHRCTQDIALDYFVMYSSVSGIIGNPRQANYVAANAMLDGLAHYRRSVGLPATSINWGSIREVGVVARNPQVEQYLIQMGVNGLEVNLATRALERVLRDNQIQQVVVDMNWERWAASSMIGTTAAMYTHLLGAQNDQSSEHAQSFQRSVNALSPEERLDWVQTYLMERISHITRMPVERLDPDERFDNLGLDSLMTIEFNNAMKSETGQEFSTMMLLQGPSIRQLAKQLLEMIGLLPEAV